MPSASLYSACELLDGQFLAVASCTHSARHIQRQKAARAAHAIPPPVIRSVINRHQQLHRCLPPAHRGLPTSYGAQQVLPLLLLLRRSAESKRSGVRRVDSIAPLMSSSSCATDRPTREYRSYPAEHRIVGWSTKPLNPSV